MSKISPKTAASTDAKDTAAQNTDAPDTTEIDGKADFKKKDLIETIVARSDHKRSDVKEITEQVLAVLGEQLDAGETLNLQPLGKVMPLTSKDVGNATISKVKIRRVKSSDASDDAKAPATA